MKGRDGILVLLVMLAVGALSILGYWVSSADFGTPQRVAVAPSSGGATGAAPSAQTESRTKSEAPVDETRAAAASARSTTAARTQSEGGSEAPPSFSASEAPPGAGAAAIDELPPGERPKLDSRLVDAAKGRTVAVDAPGRDQGAAAAPRSSVRVADAPVNDSLVESNDSEFDRSSAQPERVAAASPNKPTSRSADLDDRPSFDLVRVAPDGSTVLAGRAQPGAVVSVLLDGELATEVRADKRGEFVALVDAAFGELSTRRLTLSAKLADGEVLLSAAPVILTKPADPGGVPTAVIPSATGAVVLQAGEETKGDDVSIDAVSYDEKGNVVVAGRGKPGSKARIYLDNALSAEATVNPDGGWRVRVAQEIKPAVYTLRVDQLSTKGIVIGRAETPFERAPVEDVVLRSGNVVVQPGNSLWRIASYVYGDGLKYHVIYDGNRAQIRDPDLIYPGQILDLPNAPKGRQAEESN